MSTTLIKGGRIYDGSGNPPFDGHVLIDGDKIAAVLKEGETPPGADTVIDAKGFAVSPGFIDMHSHADWNLPVENHPKVVSCLIEQGVTTIVGGNCGFSPAPVRGESLELFDKSLAAILVDQSFDYRWSSMGEFLDNIEETKPAVNMAELVGHASIRIARAETRRGQLKPAELDGCLDELRRSFAEGACGFSLGLGYDPAMYSPLEELDAFMKVCAEADRPVTVHLKALSVLSPTYPVTYLGKHNIRALKEMLDLARKTGARLQLSHFIFVGRRSWASVGEAIEMVEQARRDGVDVMFDAFPYTCGNTTVNVVIPYWFLARLPDAYHDARARLRLRVELEIGFRLLGFTYADFQVMDAGFEGGEDLNGLTIVDIARKWNTNPFDALLKLSEKSNGGALMLFHEYSGAPGNETAIETVLSHKLCLFETDALIKSRGYPNPAAKGTFPRILGLYSRDRKMFSLADAIHRMTQASAERFNIKNHGLLKPGYAADVTIFDPAVIADAPPVGDKPAGTPKGIAHVFINGTHSLKDGIVVKGVRPGDVLRV